MKKLRYLLLSIVLILIVFVAGCNEGNPDDNLGTYYYCNLGYVDEENYIKFEKVNGSVTAVDNSGLRIIIAEWKPNSFVYYLPETTPNERKKVVGNFSSGKVEIKEITETKHAEYGNNNSISKIYYTEAEYSSSTFYKEGVYPSNRTYKITYYDTLNEKVVAVKYQNKITDIPVVKDDEYYFDGWYLSQLYLAKIEENTPVDEDLILFSKWNELNDDNSIVITFNTNGGNELSGLRVPKNGTPILPEPTKKGSVFDGWYVGESLTLKYDLNVTKNITLYAKWNDAYVVRYINYDGEVLQEDSVLKGNNTTYRGETPTKPDDNENWYFFSGWSAEAVNVSGNMDIIAQYDVVPFSTGGIAYTLSDTNDYYIVAGVKVTSFEEYVIASTYNGLPVKKIVKGAINCPNAKRIIIPDSVEYIEEEAIRNCSKLEMISVPFIGASNTGNTRFYSIFNQTENPRRIPETIKEINVTGSCIIYNSAFSGCTNVEKITIPKATKIGNTAFGQCSSLKTIEIPSTVTEIEAFAFRESGLSSVIISEGVKKIGSKAFYDNSKLEKVFIPNTIESISQDAFAGVKNLVKIYYFGETNPNITFDNADKIIWYKLTTNKNLEIRTGHWWYYDDEGRVVEVINE